MGTAAVHKDGTTLWHYHMVLIKSRENLEPIPLHHREISGIKKPKEENNNHCIIGKFFCNIDLANLSPIQILSQQIIGFTTLHMNPFTDFKVHHDFSVCSYLEMKTQRPWTEQLKHQAIMSIKQKFVLNSMRNTAYQVMFDRDWNWEKQFSCISHPKIIFE